MDQKIYIKEKFIKVMKKDAKLSMFVFGPFLLLFYSLAAYNSNWPVILSIIFTIIVFTIIFFVFYYSNLFIRGELMLRVANEIIIYDDKLVVKSFGWFFKKQKEYHFKSNAIKNANKNFKIFKYEGIKLQIVTDSYKVELLLISDFFDNLNCIIPKGN